MRLSDQIRTTGHLPGGRGQPLPRPRTEPAKPFPSRLSRSWLAAQRRQAVDEP